MTEVELQTKPAVKEDDSEVQKNTLEKLKVLIEENPPVDDEEEKDKEEKHEGDSGSDTENEYDEDGFKVPAGKIPIDGHFTTKEVAELIKIAKDEGVLKDDVHIDVLNTDKNFGDRIRVEEDDDDDGKKADKEKKGKDGSKKRDSEQDDK